MQADLKYFLALECPDFYQQVIKERKTNRMQRTERIHGKRRKYYNFSGIRPQVALETPKRSSSCRCCNNPRKNAKCKDRLTLQERKNEEEVESQLRNLRDT